MSATENQQAVREIQEKLSERLSAAVAKGQCPDGHVANVGENVTIQSSSPEGGQCDFIIRVKRDLDGDVSAFYADAIKDVISGISESANSVDEGKVTLTIGKKPFYALTTPTASVTSLAAVVRNMEAKDASVSRSTS